MLRGECKGWGLFKQWHSHLYSQHLNLDIFFIRMLFLNVGPRLLKGMIWRPLGY